MSPSSWMMLKTRVASYLPTVRLLSFVASAIGTPRGMTITHHPSSGACVDRIRRRVRELAFSKTMSCVHLWAAADGVFGAFVRVALLTGQRREKIISMRWEDIKDGEWRIPAVGSREEHRWLVGAAASRARHHQCAATLREQSLRLRRDRHQPHRRDEQAQGEASTSRLEFLGWTIHDLRRTARSLMTALAFAPILPSGSLATPSRASRGFMTGTPTAMRRPMRCAPWRAD